MPEIKPDEKVLAAFVDRLIANKGGSTLDATQKETLQGELLEQLDDRIQHAMIGALPDAKIVELEKLLDADAPDEEVEKIFQESGADYSHAIRKAMDDFQTDYFTDKIEVSVKTQAPLRTGKVAASPAPTAPVASPAVGAPVQGMSSVEPGRSDVEGVAAATATDMTAPAPMSVGTQGAVTMPEVATPASPAAATDPVVTPEVGAPVVTPDTVTPEAAGKEA